MKRGYWDRDGFHEGPMPAADFCHVRDSICEPDGSVVGIDRSPIPYWNNATSADAGRYESGRPSGQVANSPQPVIGSPRGGCNSPDRASRHTFQVGTYQGVPVFACEDMTGEHDDGR